MMATCGTCIHFHAHPIDPNNVAKADGECRHGPPQPVVIMVRPGQAEVRWSYPTPIPVGFAACGQYDEGKARADSEAPA